MPVCTYDPHTPHGSLRRTLIFRHAASHIGCHSEVTTPKTSSLPPPSPVTALLTTHVGLTLECQGCVGWRRCRLRQSSDDTRAIRTRMVTHRDSQRSLCRLRWRQGPWPATSPAPSLPCWRHRTPRRMRRRRWTGCPRGATRCAAAQTRSRRRKAPSPKRFVPSGACVEGAARVNTHLATQAPQARCVWPPTSRVNNTTLALRKKMALS